MRVYKVTDYGSNHTGKIDKVSTVSFISIMSVMMNKPPAIDGIHPVPQACAISTYPTITKNAEIKEIKND